MLTDIQKSTYRSTLFKQLDGVVTAPTAYTLYKHNVLNHLIEESNINVGTYSTKVNANEGYLNVALRILSSQGWIYQQINCETNAVSFSINEKSKLAFELIPLFSEVVELMKFSEKFHPRKFEIAPFLKLEQIFEHYTNQYNISFSDNLIERSIQEQVLTLIEGAMISPTIVQLGMSGMFHKYFMEASFKPEEFHDNAECFRKILNVLAGLGWFTKQKETYRFTEKGLFFAKRASSYGVTVSYSPTLRNLDELIFGNPLFLESKEGEHEKHVDRAMNVWGSGGAHGTYFKTLDKIVIDIFNGPIEEQPRGILDMGCGNGAFIQHLFELIDKHTLRGKMLDTYPLFLVGADYNKEALKITRSNLIKADIWSKVIWGDIGQPDLLANDLRENYDIKLEDLLNVRTFLDHNRIWKFPKKINQNRKSKSTGAFVSKGKRLTNNHVEDSLFEHLSKWKPFVDKHGLLIIELHTISPDETSKNLGKTAATAYDATHGFSDQYILEIDVFRKIAEEVGLYLSPEHSKKFPNSNLATISVNLFKGRV